MKKIIDSHVHLDLIEKHHPHRIPWLRANNCTVVSWSYFEGIDSLSQLALGLKVKSQTMHRLSAGGLACHYLAGVHPRSIPSDLKPEAISALLRPFWEDPLCLGIGEIGLETGTAFEYEVLISQLELMRGLVRHGKIVGIHTPRSDKLAMTSETLKILERFVDLAPVLVVDHCTIQTIAAVLAAGFWAGVTLSPIKSSWDDMKRIVSSCTDRVDRIMCNTDSGSLFFEDAVTSSRAGDLPVTIRQKLFHDNAARFFNLDSDLEG